MVQLRTPSINYGEYGEART